MSSVELRTDKIQSFWNINHPRLSEAVDRISCESPDHGWYKVAEEEIAQLYDEALAGGISPEDFLLMLNQAYVEPWRDEDGSYFIETSEGQQTYNFGGQKPIIHWGKGSLPAEPPGVAVELLKRVMGHQPKEE